VGNVLGNATSLETMFPPLQVKSDSKTSVDMITRKVKINGKPPILMRRIQDL